MPVIQRRITIDAPAGKIFSYLADFTRHHEWAAHKLEIRQTSQGPVGVGTTFVSVGHQMGRHEDKVTVTEFVPNERIGFESVGDAGRYRYYFLLREEGERTYLTKASEALQMSFPFSILAPIATTFMIPRQYDGDLKRIKANLESSR